MSVQQITLALALRNVSQAEKLLLIVLANYADEDGRCWPSQKRLGEDAGMSDRSVRTALVKLEEAGLIVRERRNRRDGSRGTDMIELHLERANDQRKNLPAEKSSSGKSCTDYRKNLHELPENISGLTTFEPTIEPSIEPSKARTRYPEGFEAVWKAYPHTQGRSSKPESLKVWTKLPAEERAGLMGAIRQFTPRVEKICGGCGAPDMAVWLRQGKHLAWIEAEAARPSAVTFAGPAEVRRIVVEAKGEGFASAYLDHCRWDDGPRRLLAKTDTAATTLGREVGRVLQEQGVTIGRLS
jgi:DNA-binding transcriptional ArsR family regulator